MNNNIIITYESVTDEDLRLRRDPAWYVSDPAHHEHIATVIKGDREVRVFRDGEMRIHIWDNKKAQARGSAPDIIRYTDTLVGAGIETDEQLARAFDEGRVEWCNNAWFDLYAYGSDSDDPVWLDCVQHDLPTVINEAKRALEIEDIWVVKPTK